MRAYRTRVNDFVLGPEGAFVEGRAQNRHGSGEMCACGSGLLAQYYRGHQSGFVCQDCFNRLRPQDWRPSARPKESRVGFMCEMVGEFGVFGGFLMLAGFGLYFLAFVVGVDSVWVSALSSPLLFFGSIALIVWFSELWQDAGLLRKDCLSEWDRHYGAWKCNKCDTAVPPKDFDDCQHYGCPCGERWDTDTPAREDPTLSREMVRRACTHQ